MPSDIDALVWALHRDRWPCSEDRDSCDPDLNPNFHAAQVAGLSRWLGPSAMARFGSGLTLGADGRSGSRSAASAGADLPAAPYRSWWGWEHACSQDDASHPLVDRRMGVDLFYIPGRSMRYLECVHCRQHIDTAVIHPSALAKWEASRAK